MLNSIKGKGGGGITDLLLLKSARNESAKDGVSKNKKGEER